VFEDRFWPKVNKETSDGCWEWTGKIVDSGYGILAVIDPTRGVRPCGKLTKQQIEEIRHIYATSGFRQTELAKMYKVSQQLISAVVNRLLWHKT